MVETAIVRHSRSCQGKVWPLLQRKSSNSRAMTGVTYTEPCHKAGLSKLQGSRDRSRDEIPQDQKGS